jgi:hypothetical protein
MTDPKPLDLAQARLDPASVFATPQDVVLHPDLDRAQKIEILRRWKYDAADLAVAEEEGMGGGEASFLSRVTAALTALGAGHDETASPTKQGGG